MKRIVLVNHSPRITDAELRLMAQAITLQIAEDYCPAWMSRPIEVTADLAPDPTAFSMALVPKLSDAQALGYHTIANGKPFGLIGVDVILDDASGGVLARGDGDASVSSVVSHECLEAIADVDCNFWADGPKRRSYALEVCDPVQGDSYSKPLSVVELSNFILPEWFNAGSKNQIGFDCLGRLKKPFSMSPGGYMVVRTTPGTEKQVFGAIKPPAWRRKKSKGSRTVYRKAG